MTGSRAGLGALILGTTVCINWRSFYDSLVERPVLGWGVISIIILITISILNSSLYIIDRFRAVLQGQQTGHRLQAWSQ
ncbi:MAG: hypothetical protein ABEI86_03100, partial [Halobacteriaceae archaeon]